MKMSSVLRSGQVKILNPQECPARTHMNKLYNFNSMMCAFSESHVDSCQVGKALTFDGFVVEVSFDFRGTLVV
jgi:hypothetical protein